MPGFSLSATSSPTRNPTRGPCSGSLESSPLNRQGKPQFELLAFKAAIPVLPLDEDDIMTIQSLFSRPEVSGLLEKPFGFHSYFPWKALGS